MLVTKLHKFVFTNCPIEFTFGGRKIASRADAIVIEGDAWPLIRYRAEFTKHYRMR